MSDMDIIERLKDLHKQATTERSHFYVATCCLQAIEEIRRLRKIVNLMADHIDRPNSSAKE